MNRGDAAAATWIFRGDADVRSRPPRARRCKSSGAMKDFLMVVGFAVILILFFSINDIIRPQYPVLDAVLTSYQVLFAARISRGRGGAAAAARIFL